MIVINAVIESTAEDIAALKGAFNQPHYNRWQVFTFMANTFSVELNNPGVLRVTEKWNSVEDLKAHFDEPHMATFQAAMANHAPSSLDVKFYEVQEIQPL